MKTTMTTRRLAATLPAARRLAIPLLRHPMEPAPGRQPARRPAIPLAPITSTANMEENATAAATQDKKQDDGHNLPSGKRRETVVKERGGEGRPPVPAGTCGTRFEGPKLPASDLHLFLSQQQKYHHRRRKYLRLRIGFLLREKAGERGKKKNQGGEGQTRGGSILMSTGGSILVGVEAERFDPAGINRRLSLLSRSRLRV